MSEVAPYRVQAGDNLWNIIVRDGQGEVEEWTAVCDELRARGRDPNLIHENEELSLSRSVAERAAQGDANPAEPLPPAAPEDQTVEETKEDPGSRDEQSTADEERAAEVTALDHVRTIQDNWEHIKGDDDSVGAEDLRAIADDDPNTRPHGVRAEDWEVFKKEASVEHARTRAAAQFLLEDRNSIVLESLDTARFQGKADGLISTTDIGAWLGDQTGNPMEHHVNALLKHWADLEGDNGIVSHDDLEAWAGQDAGNAPPDGVSPESWQRLVLQNSGNGQLTPGFSEIVDAAMYLLNNPDQFARLDTAAHAEAPADAEVSLSDLRAWLDNHREG